MVYLERTLRAILLLGIAYYIGSALVSGDTSGLVGIAIFLALSFVLSVGPAFVLRAVLGTAERARKNLPATPPKLVDGKYCARIRLLIRVLSSILLLSIAIYPIVYGSSSAIIELIQNFSWSIGWWNQAAFQVWFLSFLLYVGLVGIEAYVFRLRYDAEHLAVTSMLFGTKTHLWHDLKAAKRSYFWGRTVLKFRNSGKSAVPRSVEGYAHLLEHAHKNLTNA